MTLGPCIVFANEEEIVNSSSEGQMKTIERKVETINKKVSEERKVVGIPWKSEHTIETTVKIDPAIQERIEKLK